MLVTWARFPVCACALVSVNAQTRVVVAYASFEPHAICVVSSTHSVVVSYKPSMLVTWARFPVCAYFRFPHMRRRISDRAQRAATRPEILGAGFHRHANTTAAVEPVSIS